MENNNNAKNKCLNSTKKVTNATTMEDTLIFKGPSI